MKKINIILAAAAAAFALAACDKAAVEEAQEQETIQSTENIKINITVADYDTTSKPSGVATKAVKTGWADGDQINIWYDSNTQNNPDLVIKYDSTTEKWDVDNTAATSGNEPNGTTLKAVYSNGLIVAANSISYTYTNSTLTANIDTWTYLTEIQIVVSGITYDSNVTYTLACSKLTPCTGYTVGADAIKATTGTKGAAVTGASNADGVAFVFATTDSYGKSANYSLNLAEGGTTKLYSADSKTLTKGTGKAIALKIAESKFREYVTIGGKKWATMNVGATNGDTAASWYGDYFAWGEVKPYATLTFSSEKSASCAFSSETTWGGTSTAKTSYSWQNYCGSSSFSEWSTTPYSNNVLTGAHDAATQNWGTGWRMPTGGSGGEFNSLYTACGSAVSSTAWDATTHAKGIYWVTDYDGISNLKGMVFCDGTNYVFFPAAGFCSSLYFECGSTNAYYWSSSLYTRSTEQAYYLRFNSNPSVYYGADFAGRYQGYSVRPVVAE